MILYHAQVLVFFLLVARFAGLMLFAPIFNRKEIPTTVKVTFILWVSGVLLFIVPLSNSLPDSPVGYLIIMVSELVIGVLVGFVTDIIITAIEFAGSLMDTQAGLSVAAVLDPSSGRQITILSRLLKWIAVMMFLIVDGHHLVLSSLVRSFYLLPVGIMPNLVDGGEYLSRLGTYIFFLAVQLSAPIMLVVFLIDFGFGMLNKVAEQVNVFQLGFQVKPLVSLVIFLAVAPGLVHSIMGILEKTGQHIIELFAVMQAV